MQSYKINIKSINRNHSVPELPRGDDGDPHRRDRDHGHGAPRLGRLHVVLVGVDRAEAGLEVVVVVVVPVVVYVDDDVADLVEWHQHEGQEVVGVEAEAADAARAVRPPPELSHGDKNSEPEIGTGSVK